MLYLHMSYKRQMNYLEPNIFIINLTPNNERIKDLPDICDILLANPSLKWDATLVR
jgi:hypothetical protein